jgi:hypothetical protein
MVTPEQAEPQQPGELPPAMAPFGLTLAAPHDAPERDMVPLSDTRQLERLQAIFRKLAASQGVTFGCPPGPRPIVKA